MRRIVAIVSLGDPGNSDFNYRVRARDLGLTLSAQGCQVSLVDSWRDGLAVLNEAHSVAREKKEVCSLFLVFLSTYFCDKAFRLAKELRHQIRVVVYSFAEHPRDLPVLLFRGTHEPEVLRSIFH